MTRPASAIWHGNLKAGTGLISTGGGGLQETQHSFGTRFENGIGAKPEELIAAAPARCPILLRLEANLTRDARLET